MRPRIPFVPRPAALPPVALAGGALAVGVGGLYLAGLLLAGGEIEAGTTVRGVDIEGLTREEAAQKLERHLVAAGPRELAVKVGDREGTVDPRRAGFAFDIQETLDRAASTGSDPVSVIGGLFRSGGEIEPVVRVEEDKARTVLGTLAKSLDQDARDGSVAFVGGRVEQTVPRTGWAMDVDASIDALRTLSCAARPTRSRCCPHMRPGRR
ncbi:hypothetical protein SHKM778_49100 [Streptomyces sp. KM77-8]|uniref:YoaR-like putative peptidoglycan binding domain-containing protein n=1 Tax=Streptomyces haneummycinicus TaxID=3074435 RepID=A0AAT9HM79_9ACTN